ncbi:hypothetical protein PsYK624_121170 [Phanerochaete sordida]|uniref:Uncharacterized protein n=1 Tax=Phanerochaete sordida TaxID=48140 RepID=A0A9P3GLX9_9APHY|nr:hypothetical protein PsYK624_121170 [Phanerochaete sordida]
MNPHTGEHLTTSRIARLLRPLRVKCQKLASYSPDHAAQKTRGSVVVTYGHASRPHGLDTGERRDEPPLAVIPPPEKLSVLSKLDRASREKLELSRRVYDVRDAFRNVLAATFTQGSSSRRGTPQPSVECPGRHVRSLAAMCASAVGQQLENQMGSTEEEREDGEEDEEDDQEIVDALYDAVYPQYRKYTIISHALSIILSQCSSNHTLLAILLELTISYGLILESRLILRHLLQRVLQASSLPSTSETLLLEIAHPAHSKYLTSLLDACCPTSGGLITADTFVQILSEVICGLSMGHGAQVWTAKPIIHLARSLRAKHYPAFLSMCASVGQFLTSHIDPSNHNSNIPANIDSVASRSGKWLSHACQHLHEISSPPLDAGAIEEIGLISDILASANLSGFHRLSVSGEARVLPDAIVCLADMLLTPPMVDLLPKPAATNLHSILRTASVRPETFGILIDVTMPPVASPSADGALGPSLVVHSTVAALDRWASTLRAHAYHLREASFWASALLHVEHLTPEPGTHYDPAAHHTSLLASLARLRCAVVQRVDAAEARCFAHAGAAPADTNSQTPRRAPAGAWRWEDMLGCWVQRTPAPALAPAAGAGSKRRSLAGPAAREDARPAKRARRTDEALREGRAGAPHAPERPGETRQLFARAHSVASSASTASAGRPDLSHAPRAPAASVVSSSVESSRLPTPQDDDDDPFLTKPPAKPAPTAAAAAASRRLSNFASILRDAQRNRVVLHADSSDDEGAWLRDADAHGPKTRHVPPVRLAERAEEDEGWDARGALDQLSSDDVLDLFAYRSSER